MSPFCQMQKEMISKVCLGKHSGSCSSITPSIHRVCTVMEKMGKSWNVKMVIYRPGKAL